MSSGYEEEMLTHSKVFIVLPALTVEGIKNHLKKLLGKVSVILLDIISGLVKLTRI